MIQIHGARNNSTYFKPIPPVSEALAKVTLKLLDAALAGAEATIEPGHAKRSERREGI